jgi:hypothetical protein
MNVGWKKEGMETVTSGRADRVTLADKSAHRAKEADQVKKSMLSNRWPLALLLAALGTTLYVMRQQSASLPLAPPMVNQPLVWSPSPQKLPPSIKVFADTGLGPTQPRAWYVDIDYNDKSLRALPQLSTAASGRETGSVMARQMGALVAINGGYFDMMGNPARTFSLVMRDGKILVPNIPIVNRSNPGRAYPVTRSAFGIRANRTFDVAWIASQGGALWSYPRPVPHSITTVAPAPTRESPAGGKAWDAVDAIGAGPTLISDGVIQNTYENEVFFGSGFTDAEPYSRAAIGFTKKNHLILFTTDGRQVEHGLTLAQTTEEMQRLGCVEAMNLDGGGSETLVVGGKCLNQAPGLERPVTSILAIVPNASKPN